MRKSVSEYLSYLVVFVLFSLVIVFLVSLIEVVTLDRREPTPAELPSILEPSFPELEGPTTTLEYEPLEGKWKIINGDDQFSVPRSGPIPCEVQ